MSAVCFVQYSTILFGLYNISLTNGSQYDGFGQNFFSFFVRFDISLSMCKKAAPETSPARLYL